MHSYHKEIRDHALDLVSQYSTFDSMDGSWSLTAQDLPDAVIDEFASIIITHDKYSLPEMFDYESCDEIKKTLIPLLTKKSNLDDKLYFISSFKETLQKGLMPKMESILEDALDDFNQCKLYGDEFDE